LHPAAHEPEPDGIFFPTTADEESPRLRVVKNQRQMNVGEPGLIGVRPKELVGGAEGAAELETVLNQPALQKLAGG